METRNSSTPIAGSDVGTIWLALELSSKRWVVALWTPLHEKPSRYVLEGGRQELQEGLLQLIEDWRQRLLSKGWRQVKVKSCFEAGRDGFWIHHWLKQAGVKNRVIDPASVQVDRRARRAKTDRLDALALLRVLMAWWRGDKAICSMVVVPTPAEEDARRLHRERQRLMTERQGHVNRIKSLAALHGAKLQPTRADRWAQLEQVRSWCGEPLPRQVKEEIEREYQRLELTLKQLRQVEKSRQEILKQAVTSPPAEVDRKAAKVLLLLRINGVGLQSSWLLAHEIFFRHFENRRRLAGYVGLGDSHWQSGGMQRQQGISKAGNPRARTAMIELAWSWLRFQKESALSKWFYARLNGAGTSKQRRIYIVALARKLLVALWQYLEDGVIPEGAKIA
jgi:transposase